MGGGGGRKGGGGGGRRRRWGGPKIQNKIPQEIMNISAIVSTLTSQKFRFHE